MTSDSFYMVNFDKKQFISPMDFGDFEGLGGYMKGRHALVVAILVSDPGHALGHFHSSLPGAWRKDNVAAVFSSTPPDTDGHVTSNVGDPGRNLYQLVREEFENISEDCIDMICNWDELVADELAQIAKADSLQLWHLGNVLSKRPNPNLENAILRHVGPNWKRIYDGFHPEQEDSG